MKTLYDWDCQISDAREIISQPCPIYFALDLKDAPVAHTKYLLRILKSTMGKKSWQNSSRLDMVAQTA